MKRHLFIIATMMTLIIVGCSGNGTKENKSARKENNIPIDTSLRHRLETFSQKPRPAGQFAFHVYDITAEKPVFGFNETLALPSASCMKLLSGVAGLHLLGCNYRYKTELLWRGSVGAEGVLNGDLAFKAGLDPQLTVQDLIPFADALKQEGVRKIAGKLIVDLTIDQPVKSEEHWYPWDLTFSKYGLLYKGGPRVINAIKAAVRSRGIAVADSQIVAAKVPQGFTNIYTSERCIGDVIKRMWKNSSNTQATSLLYTIGNKADPTKDPVTAGVEYLRNFLAQDLEMTDSTLTIHDGCGLCIHNRLSPLSLTMVLRFGYEDPNIRKMLEDNLAVSGVDGTLAREMTSSATRGKIKAKTGTLSHPYGISSLAGICVGADGHVLAFAIMDSEMSVLDARVLQRRLCEALVKNTSSK